MLKKESKIKYELIVILGATATGKTELAAKLAHSINSEIISADSRQVYRGMDLGTGKDYEDYIIDGQQIPYHLVDIANPGEKYNVFEFQKDFMEVFKQIRDKGKIPILCGGTGMYLESVLNAYKLLPVPPNPERRAILEQESMEELVDRLSSISIPHNVSDFDSKKRLIRAIEISEYNLENNSREEEFPEINAKIFGVVFDREIRRKRITERLKKRLEGGMTEEVENLLKSHSPEDLIYYGLEYKYLTLYAMGKINKEELFSQLNSAIHRFAKRQMTWFRKMEKDGHEIIWIDGFLPIEEKLKFILNQITPEI